MLDGVEDGVITQSEYLVAKLASDHRIPKRVSNSFIETVKHDDFNPDDIRFDRIQPIEDMISKAQRDNTRVQSSEGRGWRPGSHAYCEAVEADNRGFVGGSQNWTQIQELSIVVIRDACTHCCQLWRMV